MFKKGGKKGKLGGILPSSSHLEKKNVKEI
jgi:hypothetical protein